MEGSLILLASLKASYTYQGQLFEGTHNLVERHVLRIITAQGGQHLARVKRRVDGTSNRLQGREDPKPGRTKVCRHYWEIQVEALSRVLGAIAGCEEEWKESLCYLGKGEELQRDKAHHPRCALWGQGSQGQAWQWGPSKGGR